MDLPRSLKSEAAVVMESNVNVEEAIDHAQRSNGSQKYVKWQFSLEFAWEKVSLHHMSRAQKSKKPYIVIILNDLES